MDKLIKILRIVLLVNAVITLLAVNSFIIWCAYDIIRRDNYQREFYKKHGFYDASDRGNYTVGTLLFK